MGDPLNADTTLTPPSHWADQTQQAFATITDSDAPPSETHWSGEAPKEDEQGEC